MSFGSAVLALTACGPAEPVESTEALRTTSSVEQALLASPEVPLPMTATTGYQSEPAIASAGDISLVVWSESDSYGYSDVRGMRVRKSDGAPLDATPLCIACGPGIQYGASVASNGSDFLVAWDAMPGGPTTPRIHGVRVRGSDGAVLGPSRLLSTEGPPQYASSVASDGSNYLVVWQGLQLQCVYPPRQRPLCGMRRGIYGARVSAADGWGGSIVLVSQSNYPRDSPQVTYGGGNYLVTWSGTPQVDGPGPADISAARVRASDGVVLDAQARTLFTGGSNPSVASDGSGFLVVWNVPAGELRGGRLGRDGTVLDVGGFRVGQSSPEPAGGYPQTPANVLFDGSHYRAVWEQGAQLERRLVGARVTRAGLVEAGSESTLAPVRYPQAWMRSMRPAIANLSGQGRFLVGYEQQAPERRVKLRVVEDLPNGTACTQDAACQSGFCVDGVCCESACGGGSTGDCQACGVAAGGTVDGVCGAVRADAAVVCDGASTTCPADEPSASEPDLSGDKCEDTADDVVSFLAALGPESLEQPFGQSLLAKAEAASQSWQRGGAKAAEGQLRALLQQVRAQRGKKVSVSAADTLIAALTGLLGS
jgi:hypothetical protein